MRNPYLIIVLLTLFLSGCKLKEDGFYKRGKVKFFLEDIEAEQEINVDGKIEGTLTQDKPFSCKFKPSDKKHVAKIRTLKNNTSPDSGWHKATTFIVDIGSSRVQHITFKK